MYNVLVTGVGAIIGYGIVKSLKKSKYELNIIGTDIYEDAIGQQWCDGFEQAVLASSPNYCEHLKRIIEKHNIDLVIPGIEQDVEKIAKNMDYFSALHTKFVINNKELLITANDKWSTDHILKQHGVPSIPSYIDGEYQSVMSEIGMPFLLKPRRSYASKGIMTIHSEDEYEFWKKKLKDNFMVQKIVGDSDSEYTVGVFVFNNVESHKIVMQRKLSGEGSTAKAKIVHNKELEAFIDRLIPIFNPIGPTNFQFRYENGVYYLLEINPRISSSTSLRTAFGYNEAEMCIEYYLENKSPTEPKIRYGTAIRYIEDWIEYDCDHL